MMKKLAVVLAAGAACVAASSTAGAAGTGQVCPSFTQGKKSYNLETLGGGWTCSSARTWSKKLIADRVVGKVTKNVPLKNGPRGYHCFATPGSTGGHATSGACIKGTLAYPGSGFAWLPK